jgi:PAT family beta-lactamase induction signal transducer AmpG
VIRAGYFTRPLITILFLGFSSGLPLALVLGTLSAWLSEAHVDKSAIGLFAAASTPYALKFLWSPLMDGVRVPLFCRVFGRRRGWMLFIQLLLMGALMVLSFTEPESNAWLTGLWVFIVAFLAASQDIVIDAYRVERLSPEEQGPGASMAQLGYQIGMLASGAGGLALAQRVGWHDTYFLMGWGIGVGVITTLIAREPEVPKAALHIAKGFAAWIKEYVVDPFIDFTRRDHWRLIFAFVLIYKFADAFIGIMSNPFLLETGFTKDQIAVVVKVFGIAPTFIGIMLGGLLTARLGAIRVMFAAGLLHALTNMLYALLAHTGPQVPLLASIVVVEKFTSGISGAAFVAYLSGLCNTHYTATQFALLTSLAAAARTWLATPAGFVAKHLGWQWFFMLSAFLALPGLILLLVLNKRLSDAASATPHRPEAPH